MKQIQQHVKRIVHHDQLRFTPEIQGWLNIHGMKNVILLVNKGKNKNHRIILNRCRKTFEKLNIYNENAQQSRYKTPHIMKAIYDKTIANIILNVKN